ncbi:MAG: hypothetical protein C0618_03845 [Desulfuromonas sp.]|nr:MAG: hypothetical protein C0618_03845 [Desulfuromonas sp.]
MWLKAALPLVTLCLTFGFVSQALAVTVSGRTSTVLEWFDTAEEETAVPLYQYLNLNVTNIADKGWHLRSYGRLSGDLNDEVDADSRLYYVYLQKRNLLKKLDLKLGRQFIITAAGASLVDGIYLDYRNLGLVNLAFFGGGDATFYDGYHADDTVIGGELYGQFFGTLAASISYMQKWDQGDLSHELLGLDLEYDVRELDVYSETQFSWLTDEVTYFVLGGNYQPNTKWTLNTEYLYSLPVFSSTSIYSVFAVDEYQELSLEANFRIDNGFNAFGRYVHEYYESVDDANVFEAGIEKLRTLNFSGYLIGTYRGDDDGQDLYGAKAYAAYLFSPKAEAGIGFHYDVLERELGFISDGTDSRVDDTTSQRYWIDATTYITPKLNVQGKLEYVQSDLWDEYTRGRVRLNILF